MTLFSPVSVSSGQLATFKDFRLLRALSSRSPASVMFWQKLRFSSLSADKPESAAMSQSLTTRNFGAWRTRHPPRFKFWRLANGARTAKSGSGGTILAYFKLSSVSWVKQEMACAQQTKHISEMRQGSPGKIEVAALYDSLLTGYMVVLMDPSSSQAPMAIGDNVCDI